MAAKDAKVGGCAPMPGARAIGSFIGRVMGSALVWFLGFLVADLLRAACLL